MKVAKLEPVRDSVAKVDQDVAVGENLGFQRKWWRFEKAVWIFFAIVIALDVSGAFGRGPLSHGHMAASDGSLNVKYERIERRGTPSVMAVSFSADSVHDGAVTLTVSDSVVSGLGARRIIPEPRTTVLEKGGLTYTFPVRSAPTVVRFELEPSEPGLYSFWVGAPGIAPLAARVAVVP